MSEDQVIGTARVDIVVDADTASVGIAKAKSALQSFSTESQNAYNQASAAEKRATNSLLKWLELSGKTVESQKILNAAMAGVPVQILEEVRQKMMDVRASTDAAAAAAKEFSSAHDFEQQHQSAKKLVQSSEYVNFWKESLQQADAVEKQLKDNLLFDQQHLSARQLVQDSEYVSWWKDALLQADIAEKNLAESNLFDAQHQAAKQLTQSSEYVRFWEDALDEASASEAKMASDKAFLKALQDRANIAGKTSAELREMALAQLEAEAAEKGVSSQAAPFIAQLREKEAQFSQFGKTSKEVSAAMRGVPAQITDIVVSLQGGQAPLTVLLQQGGQLKDMFGGVVPAARALGSSLLGLAGNPLMLLTAGIVGLAAAYYQGSKESDEFYKALVMNGNVAGTYSDELMEMARGVSDVIGTQKQAAEVIAALAGTSNIATKNFSEYAEAAIRWNKAIGASTADTIAEFEKLGESPVAASAELNKQYRYLTSSVYEQIRALEESGRVQEAAELAQQTYADALVNRSASIVDNLGYIEAGWKNIKNAAAGAWDVMLNVGRDQTINQQLAEAESQLANMRSGMVSDGSGGLMPGNYSAAALAKQEAYILGLKETIKWTASAAEEEGKRASQEALRISLSDESAKYADKAVKKQAELNAAHEKYKDIIRDNAEAQKQYKAIVDGINEKYAEKQKGGSGRSGQSELATIKARTAAETELIARLKDRTTANAKLTDAEKAIFKLQADLAGNLDKKTRADKESALAAAQSWREEEKRRIAIEESKKAIEAAEKVTQKQIADAWKSVEATQAQTKSLEDQIKTLGMGKAAITDLKISDIDRILADADSYAEDYIAAIVRMREELEKLRNTQNTLTYTEILKQQEQELKNSEDQAALLQMQAGLLGKSGVERDKILAKLKIQQALEKEILRIKEQTLAGDERESLIANAKAQAAQDTLNASAEIDQSFNEELINNMVNAGRDVWVDFTAEGEMSFKSLERTFKATVASAIYDLTIKPIVVNVVGSMLGGSSSGNGGLGGLLGGNGGFSLSNIPGLGNSGLYTGLANSSIGQSLGLSYAPGAGGVGPAGLTGLGQGIGTALSVVGWAAAAYQLIDLIKGLDGSGDPHQGAVAWADNYGLGGAGQGHSSNPYRAEIGDALYGMGSGIASSMEQILADFGQVGKHIVVMTSWLDDFDGEGGSWGNFSISIDGNELVNWANENWDSKWSPREFSPMEEGYEEYVEAVAESYMRALTMALKDSDIPGWASSMLDAVDADATIEEINAVLTAISQTKAVFAGFADTIVGFAQLNDDAISSLLNFSGGMEPLTANMSSFYENFYSEQEKIDNLTRQMTNSLAEFGIALPASMPDYRALVEQTMAAGNTELLSVLLAMNGTFRDVAMSGESAIGVVDDVARSLSDIAKEAADLQKRLWTATGDTAALAAYDREQIDPTNWDLYDQVLQAEAKKVLEDQAKALEDSLFKITATVAEQRAAELAAMDASLRPLQERIYAIQDEKTAAEAAAAAEEVLAQQREAEAQRIASLSGLSADGLWSGVMESINNGQASAVGGNLAYTVLGGIENAIYANAGNQIMQSVIDGIITPVVTAAVTGSSVSEAISNASISNMLASANAAATALGELVKNAEWQATMGQISDLMTGLGSSLAATVPPMRYVTRSASEMGSSLSSSASKASNDAQTLINAWESVYKAIYGSMSDLRDVILGTTADQGNSFYEAQFAMLTAQARSGDQTAAAKLPEIVSKLSEYAQSNSASLFDQNSSIASYIKSLEDTQAYIAAFYKKAGGNLADLEGWDTHSVYAAASVTPVTVPDRVIPAINNSAMLNSINSGGSNSALLAEVRALRSELATTNARLAAIEGHAGDTAAHTRSTRLTLDEVTNGGEGMILAKKSKSEVTA